MEALNWNAGTLLGRDGKRKTNQDAARWEKALDGHIRSAHKGKVQNGCAGCVELQRKLKAARS